jgi:hypothetical protein
MSMHSRAGFTAVLYRLRSPYGTVFSGRNRTARALRECMAEALRNGCPNGAEPCCREAMESVARRGAGSTGNAGRVARE